MGDVTTYTNTLGFAPPIADYANRALGAAGAAVSSPYQSYADWAKQRGLSGDQVAAFTDLQKGAFTGVQNIGQDPYSQTAAQGLQNVAGTTFGQPQAEQYMSPYIQNVLDSQKRDAARMSAIQGTQQQAQAAQAGAFGGGRDAIMRAERERNLALQQGDIQAAGMQNAYTNAQNQFNADQNRGLQGYSQLGSQGQNLYGQTTGNLNLQNAYGTQQQQQGQNMIDVAQQNYAAEQNYPYKQIGFLSDIINKQPVSNLGTNITQPSPSAISQLGGLASIYYGLNKPKDALRSAAGGQVHSGLADLALSRM